MSNCLEQVKLDLQHIPEERDQTPKRQGAEADCGGFMGICFY